jgi:hypothetical protein
MEQKEACISFLEHPSFSKEITKFNKKYDGGGIGYKSLKRLLEQQLNPANRQIILSSTILRRVDNLGANLEVYKITMRVKGLSSGQSPRVCFRYVGNLIVFLCFGTHIDNYKDSELKKEIKARIEDLDPEVQFS